VESGVTGGVGGQLLQGPYRATVGDSETGTNRTVCRAFEVARADAGMSEVSDLRSCTEKV